MSEILSGIALVLSLIAIVTVLALAHELSLVRGQQTASTAPGPSLPSVQPTVVRALTGIDTTIPPESAAVLLFMLRGCQPCEAVLAGLADAAVETRSNLYLVARAEHALAEEWAQRAKLARDNVIVDDGKISAQFSVSSYPMAVTTAQGRIRGVFPVRSVSDLDRFYQSVPEHAHVGPAPDARPTPERMDRPVEMVS